MHLPAIQFCGSLVTTRKNGRVFDATTTTRDFDERLLHRLDAITRKKPDDFASSKTASYFLPSGDTMHLNCMEDTLEIRVENPADGENTFRSSLLLSFDSMFPNPADMDADQLNLLQEILTRLEEYMQLPSPAEIPLADRQYFKVGCAVDQFRKQLADL